MFRNTLALLAATVWISASEFFRNQFLFKSLWVAHYQKLGVAFPAEPINGAIWGLWSLAMALLIFILIPRYKLWQTTLIAWLASFVMMWLVIGNLGVLPHVLLWYAVPLSLLECFVAALILTGLHKKRA